MNKPTETITVKLPKKVMEEFDRLPKDKQKNIISQTRYFTLAYLKEFIKNAKRKRRSDKK